jgi:hypothetical protein
MRSNEDTSFISLPIQKLKRIAAVWIPSCALQFADEILSSAPRPIRRPARTFGNEATRSLDPCAGLHVR